MRIKEVACHRARWHVAPLGFGRQGRCTSGVIIALVILAAVVDSTAPAAGTTYSHSPFGEFPLWKDVPAQDFAVLKEGQSRHGTRWGLYTYRRAGGGSRAGKRPCILLASITAAGQYGMSAECGPLAPTSDAAAPPVSVGGGFSYNTNTDGAVMGESFWGMTFAANIAKVEVEVEPGTPVVRRVQYLSTRQSQKAHVKRFRYLVFNLSRDVCLDRVNGEDQFGQVVLKASFNECPLRGR